MIGALAVVVTEPAASWTIERKPEEIVVTSRRLDDVKVGATLTLTLRSNGDAIFRAGLRNSGRTRRLFVASGHINFPESGFDISPAIGGKWIGPGSSRSWELVVHEPLLARRWDRVRTRSIEALFDLDAIRVQGA